MAHPRTAETEVFDVVLIGFGPGAQGAVDDLRHTFGIDQRAAERLVRSLPAKVKRGVPRVRAEYFRRALQRIGADVEVRDAGGNVIAAPPLSVPPPELDPPYAPPTPENSERAPADTFLDPGARPEARAGARTLVAAPATAQPAVAPAFGEGLAGSARDTLREAVPAPRVTPNSAHSLREPAEATVQQSAPPRSADSSARSPSLRTAFGPPDAAVSAPAPAPAPGGGAAPWAAVAAVPEAWRAADPVPFASRPTDFSFAPLDSEPRNPPAPLAGHPARHVRPKFDISESIEPRPAPAPDAPMQVVRGAALPGDPMAQPPPRSARRPQVAPRPARPAAAPAVAPQPEPAVELDSFFAELGGALALPFTGQGPYWIAAIAVWSVAVGVLGMLAQFVPLLGALVSFFAYTSVLAFTCDFARVCFWVEPSGESELDVAPSLDPVRLLNVYIKSGLHLMAFVLISNVALAIWVAVQLFDGAGMDVLTDPFTWAIALGPSLYWPIAIALSAVGNSFGAIWNVPAGLRAIARAPLEYALIAGAGAATLVLSGVLLLLFGGMLGAAAPFMSPVAGLPLAISHGLMGSLFGHLARARPEVFEN